MHIKITEDETSHLSALAKEFIFENFPLGSRVRTAKVERQLVQTDRRLNEILQSMDKKTNSRLFSVRACPSATCPEEEQGDILEGLTEAERNLIKEFPTIENNDNLVTEIASKVRDYEYLKKQPQTPTHKLSEAATFLRQYVAERDDKGTVQVIKPPSQLKEDEVRLRIDITNIFSAMRLIYNYDTLINLRVNVAAEKLFDELSVALDDLIIDF